MLGDKRYCYPLTVTDHATCYLLLCEAMESNAEKPAFTAFERLFKERGLPRRFARIMAFRSLSLTDCSIFFKLSVWWLRLGITIERIKPGHPQQNGRHERMHLTLKKEAARPAGAHILQQQGKFDEFIEEFNTQRPHEVLQMKCPANIYTASNRPYRGIQDLQYPFHNRTGSPAADGFACIEKKINLSRSLADQAVGVKEVDSGIWLVSFMDYDLGYADL